MTQQYKIYCPRRGSRIGTTSFRPSVRMSPIRPNDGFRAFFDRVQLNSNLVCALMGWEFENDTIFGPVANYLTSCWAKLGPIRGVRILTDTVSIQLHVCLLGECSEMICFSDHGQMLPSPTLHHHLHHHQHHHHHPTNTSHGLKLGHIWRFGTLTGTVLCNWLQKLCVCLLHECSEMIRFSDHGQILGPPGGLKRFRCSLALISN